jgi:predicted kinase
VGFAVLRAPLAVCRERARDRRREPLEDPAVIERLWRSFSDLGDLEPHALDLAAKTPEAAAELPAERLAEGALAI